MTCALTFNQFEPVGLDDATGRLVMLTRRPATFLNPAGAGKDQPPEGILIV
jgi:hypothetical protein